MSSTQAMLAVALQSSRTILPIVLIPAYKPSSGLTDLVHQLAKDDHVGAVVVVNDGSGPAYQSIFEGVAAIQKTHVLTHVVNLGKGAALKTGLNYAACQFPEAVGVVTADADGQHTVPDILTAVDGLCGNPHSLVLGARRFDGDVPQRSKIGNIATRYIMRAVTGQKLTDTQTGLRGIPMEFIPELLRSKATGYDFELDMLVRCKYTSRPVKEVSISTIYIDQNRSSHFNPLLDSMRIYFVFVRFAAVSVVTAAIDNMVFILALNFSTKILICQAAGRLAAGTFNYYTSKTGVFHSKAHNTIAFPKYWLSVFLVGGLSYALIHSILKYSSLNVVSAKMVAETILFFFSFVIQRDFVFSQDRSQKAT